MSAKKVLIIDDSQTIRRSAENMLSSEGVEILTAEDGFQALSIIAEEKPSLIFIDIVMPKLDGYQACAIIKNNPEFQHIPVIMLTSKDGLFDRARGQVVGSDHYLTKPFTKDELLQSLQQHMPA
ncbi:MAG: response regulator [Gammaproteobacteria bacterium]|nr:response regulator [Gammaproteobacteria bacterium]